jgi:hypothetical protein
MLLQCFRAFGGLALLVPLVALPAAAGAEKKSAEEDAVFKLREVSALQKNDIQGSPYRLALGDFAACSSEPDKAVKAYPKLNSKHPLYGTFHFDHNTATGNSIEIHFVLDESGESPPAKEKKDKDVAGKKTPRKFRPSRYDRLYIDLNRDLDLTNDPVIKSMKDPPWQALPPWEVKERAAFEYMNVNVDYGPGVGVRRFRILPWLTGGEADDKDSRYTMHFVATIARQGRIRIGKHEYDALLAQPYRPSGRFDRPMTALFLKPLDPGGTPDADGFSGEMLSTVQRVDGQLYVLSATPLGDKLTVRPYRGDFGVVKIGPGGRKIKDFSFEGSFASETMSLALAPDASPSQRNREKSQEYRVPVGDYVASYLRVKYGPLAFSLSENYHSDGHPRSLCPCGSREKSLIAGRW